MLAITQDAAEAITGIVSQAQAPEGSGVRISPRVPEGLERGGVDLSLVEVPAEADQVVEEQGARVFVDNQLAPELDDKVLDASVQEDRVQFRLMEQPPAGQS